MEEGRAVDPPGSAGMAAGGAEPIPSLHIPVKRPSVLKKNQPDVVCKRCGKSFANSTNRKRHEKTCHVVAAVAGKLKCQPQVKPEPQEQSPAAAGGIAVDSAQKQPRYSFPANFICPTCDRTFRCKSDYARHEKTHLKDRFTCSCGKNFGTEKHLRGHERNCGLPDEVRQWAQGCTYSC